MSRMRSYRWCFIPSCTNTTKSAPHKTFINVPHDEKRRRLWFYLAGRDDAPTQSNYFCCEDHFNLENDMENYMRWKMTGCPKKLKKGVVPRKFCCQMKQNDLPPQILDKSPSEPQTCKRLIAPSSESITQNMKDGTQETVKVKEEPLDSIYDTNFHWSTVTVKEEDRNDAEVEREIIFPERLETVSGGRVIMDERGYLSTSSVIPDLKEGSIKLEIKHETVDLGFSTDVAIDSDNAKFEYGNP